MGKSPQVVRLVCWKTERSAELASELESSGFAVDAGPLDQSVLKNLAKTQPGAVVIDLGKLPAQGRDFGIVLRTRAGSRSLPLVFVDGSESAVKRTREILPDAVYASRPQMAAAITEAIRNPPADPIVPSSAFAGYSGTPLPKKLGIKAGASVALVNAPEAFEKTLGELPKDVIVSSNSSPDAAVTLWFLDSLDSLNQGIHHMAEVAGDGRLWICWPKKASGIVSDVTQNQVRSIGLAAGIVDFKICAIDATWSGLCFTRRKK